MLKSTPWLVAIAFGLFLASSAQAGPNGMAKAALNRTLPEIKFTGVALKDESGGGRSQRLDGGRGLA